MFSARTRALVKSLGAEGDLIYNENVNETIKMLTLVKVKQKWFWPAVTYTIIDQMLLDLLEDSDMPPDYTEDVLTENFKNQSIKQLRKSCSNKTDEDDSVVPIHFFWFHQNPKEEEMTFTVPQESTLAYDLMQISTEDGTLGIPPRTNKLKQYNKEIWMKGRLLQPLEDLPASNYSDLLKKLLEDRRALALLEQTLDQDATEPCDTHGPSQPVSSFMDLLEASGASTSQRDAAHLLVSAMNTLPDYVPALLIRCCPDVLTVLNQVDSQNQLAEPLPPPLQEDGELSWVAQLLCSSPLTLTELSEQWDCWLWSYVGWA